MPTAVRSTVKTSTEPKKGGRKLGEKQKAQQGSAAWHLAQLEVGEFFFRETSMERWARDMTVWSVPRTRRPADLQGKEFTAALYTAVGSKAGDIRYLICMTRTT
jgi:hypothetical protein